MCIDLAQVHNVTVRAAPLSLELPLNPRLSSGSSTRFADAGGHAPDRPVTTQTCRSGPAPERPLWAHLPTLASTLWLLHLPTPSDVGASADAPRPSPRPRRTTPHARSPPPRRRPHPRPSPSVPVGSRAALATRLPALVASARRKPPVRLDFLSLQRQLHHSTGQHQLEQEIPSCAKIPDGANAARKTP